MTKECTKCHQEKSLNEFSKCKTCRPKNGYKSRCKECISKDEFIYRMKFSKRINLKQRKNRLEDPERFRNYDKVKLQRHKHEINERTKLKYRTDSRFRLRRNIGSLIGIKLKNRLSSKKGKSSFTFLPYTIDQLIKHLEKKFQSGMTWKNYGMFGWHIDHVIPDCHFNYKNIQDKEFQKSWALKNLQPLWAIDNLKKGNKLNYIYEQTK